MRAMPHPGEQHPSVAGNPLHAVERAAAGQPCEHRNADDAGESARARGIPPPQPIHPQPPDEHAPP